MSFEAPDSLPLFYAHALALERESVERYEELADAMATHNNDELAALFRRLAGYGEQHASEVERLASDYELPRLAPWEFRWIDAEGPETTGYGDVHYLMTSYHALQYALENERRGRDYYARVAARSGSKDVRQVAAAFAAEEEEHVHEVAKWLDSIAAPGADWDIELDPPNQPE